MVNKIALSSAINWLVGYIYCIKKIQQRNISEPLITGILIAW
ncbi:MULTISPECIES: hypothetical protein [Bacillus cereus group]|nr:hypothetical protein [Bacillus sp. FDAARGOS_235]